VLLRLIDAPATPEAVGVVVVVAPIPVPAKLATAAAGVEKDVPVVTQGYLATCNALMTTFSLLWYFFIMSFTWSRETVGNMDRIFVVDSSIVGSNGLELRDWFAGRVDGDAGGVDSLRRRP
jgi:hypothetical protein